jgi:hypothetical protein
LPNPSPPDNQNTYNPTAFNESAKRLALKKRKSALLKNFESPIMEMNDYAEDLKLSAIDPKDAGSPKPDYHNPKNFVDCWKDKKLAKSMFESLKGCSIDDSTSQSDDNLHIAKSLMEDLGQLNRDSPGKKSGKTQGVSILGGLLPGLMRKTRPDNRPDNGFMELGYLDPAKRQNLFENFDAGNIPDDLLDNLELEEIIKLTQTALDKRNQLMKLILRFDKLIVVGKKALKRKAGKGDTMNINRMAGAYGSINVMPNIGGKLSRPQGQWKSAAKVKTMNDFKPLLRPRSSVNIGEIQQQISGLTDKVFGATTRSKFFLW